MPEVVPYEVRAQASGDQLLREASEFFMGQGSINRALRDLAADLEAAAIPYAVLGAIAMGRHGMVRMTLDLDILLTPEGLAAFKERYSGRGYVPAFPGAEKTFRSAATGVRIEVITTGEYPGDGKPKAVRFPDPAEASVDLDGVRIISLERLVDLKLASGMTAPHRLRDLSDVIDLIRALRLPSEFADKLDASVREMYRQLWEKGQTVDQVVEEPYEAGATSATSGIRESLRRRRA